MSSFEDGNKDAVKYINAEAEARQQLEDVSKQLEKYQSVYGDVSALSPNVQRLSDQLRQKEDEIQKLRLLDTQRDQVSI